MKITQSNFVSFRGDPYLQLANAHGFVDYADPKSRWVDIVVEFDSIKAVTHLKWLQSTMPFALRFAISSFDTVIVSGRVRRCLLQFAIYLPGVVRYEIADAFGAPRLPPRRPRVPVRSSITGKEVDSPQRNSVLRAVIDTSCPFAHHALRAPNGATLVRAIWDQDVRPDFGHLGKSPPIFQYGSVIRRGLLNAAIAKSPAHTVAGEKACYALAGYGELDRRSSHGAHVLGLFLNGGCRLPSSSDEDVLFVQLPRNLLSVPSRAALAKAIYDGILWVLSEATKHEKHIVVNVSYGTSRGSHDGSSLFEKAVDKLVMAAKGAGVQLDVVFAAGNDYEQELHAEISGLKKTGIANMRWRIPPGNEIAAFVELWIPRNDAVSVSIKLPSGESLTLVGQGIVCHSKNNSVSGLTSAWTAEDGASLTLIRIAPTRGGAQPAATGDYVVTVTASAECKATIHAYVSHARGTSGYGAFATQTHLVSSNIANPLRVEKIGTLSGFCCSTSTIAVGAYEFRSSSGARGLVRQATEYTASGPARNGASKGCPDYSALAETSRTLFGLRGIGNFSACTVRMNGTSAAAPQVARHLVAGTPLTVSCADARLGHPLDYACAAGAQCSALVPSSGKGIDGQQH